MTVNFTYFWYVVAVLVFITIALKAWKESMQASVVTIPRRIDTTNLNTATAQEVFDWVVYNLRLQNCASTINSRCRYRAEGLSCAAGFVIADEHYSQAFEGRDWHFVAEWLGTPVHSNMIKDMQNAHDICNFTAPGGENSVWDSLRRVADMHHVSPAILDAPI